MDIGLQPCQQLNIHGASQAWVNKKALLLVRKTTSEN